MEIPPLILIITNILTLSIAVTWKVSQYAYKRQVETLKDQNNFLRDQVGSVDLLKERFKIENEKIKLEYEQALRDKDGQKIKDFRALQEQNASLLNRIEELRSQVDLYQKSADIVAGTTYPTGTTFSRVNPKLTFQIHRNCQKCDRQFITSDYLERLCEQCRSKTS